jgi:hypothetical protein
LKSSFTESPWNLEFRVVEDYLKSLTTNLVNEDGARCVELSHLEEQPHQPLGLPTEFGGQGGGGNVEE